MLVQVDATIYRGNNGSGRSWSCSKLLYIMKVYLHYEGCVLNESPLVLAVAKLYCRIWLLCHCLVVHLTAMLKSRSSLSQYIHHGDLNSLQTLGK